MKHSPELVELVHQLSRLVENTRETKTFDLEAMRAELLNRQPIPTDGQLEQLAAIERGEKVNDRNCDVRRISWLGYVGQRADGSLLLSPIGRRVLDKFYQK
jgi:predicted transcriptional regulator